MRSLWKGSISFGLVNIPVKLYGATESHDVHFHLIHRPCGTQIRYRRFCPACNREAGSDEVSRGYEYGAGEYILLEEQDFEALPLRTEKSIEIHDFVDAGEIDPIFFERSYYIEPADGGRKAYTLLREAMQESARVAVAKVALRTKESLALVRVYREILLLETMFFPDEIRSYESLEAARTGVAVSDRELDMARQLIDTLTSPFSPEKYRDEYRDALSALIEQKARGREIVTPPRPVVPAADLMQALEESLRLIRERGRPAVVAETRP